MLAAMLHRCSPSYANCSVAMPCIAVAVVHHAKKGAGALRAGQALRGSSEFYAWGDSNLYLRLDDHDRIIYCRASSRCRHAWRDELLQRDNILALEPDQTAHRPDSPLEPSSLDQRITAALADSPYPQPFADSCILPCSYHNAL
jgi:hypothetical protein